MELRVDVCPIERTPVLPSIVLRIERVDTFDVKIARFPMLVLTPAKVLCCI